MAGKKWAGIAIYHKTIRNIRAEKNCSRDEAVKIYNDMKMNGKHVEAIEVPSTQVQFNSPDDIYAFAADKLTAMDENIKMEEEKLIAMKNDREKWNRIYQALA